MPETAAARRSRPARAGFARAFSRRLVVWYVLVFLAGGAALLGLTYALLDASLRERDRELVVSALEQYSAAYARGGCPALSDAVAGDGLAGRTEGLVVRVTGRTGQAVFASVPGGWQAPGFEVASLRLPDGTVFEVAKSSEARADILARFRSRGLLGFAAVLLLGTAGGALAARSGLRRCGGSRWCWAGSCERAGRRARAGAQRRRPARRPLPASPTRCWTVSSRCSRPCAARSTTWPTTCGRRCSGCAATAEAALQDGDQRGGPRGPRRVHRGVRPRRGDADDAHGHLRGRDGRDGAAPRASRRGGAAARHRGAVRGGGRGEGRCPHGRRGARNRGHGRPHAAAAGAREPSSTTR